jgi:signal peptidase II
MVFLLAAFDVLTKLYFTKICENGAVPIIGGFLCLMLVHNFGAAFGLMKKSRSFFIIFSLFSIFFISFLMKICKTKNLLFEFGCLFLVGGALGNLIDRILHGFVIDFIYFSFINFPVFNFADVFITFGAALLFVYFVLFDKSLVN